MTAVAPDTLALFDLDHTLIPFDSGMAWTHFLVGRGVLPREADADYLGYCHQYVAGTLDFHAMHRASMQPLLRVPRAVLAQWLGEFGTAIAPRAPEPALALVRHHREAGHLCAIVTATSGLIAAPFGRMFGLDHVVATRSATVLGAAGAAAGGAADAPLTGEIDGVPCYREGKLAHVSAWLASQPPGVPRRLSGFARSWFYSDSASDLPLLEAVTDPVAVRPDARLRAHAVARGWPILAWA